MKSYDEMAKTGGKLTDCIKKNCAKDVKLHAYMEDIDGLRVSFGSIGSSGVAQLPSAPVDPDA